MNIYVGNLPRSTNEESVRNLFAAHGNVDSVRLIKDRYTGELRGFGFVEMPDQNEANQAINEINNSPFEGRTLTVNEARPRKTSFSHNRSNSYRS